MKYFVLIPDGMADRPVKELGNKTPMEAAHKPNMDALCKKSLCGTVLNVPNGMVPESDTANLAILSYNPAVYSKGRSPLEAMSMGLAMEDDDTAIRCNIVTVSEDQGDGSYEDQIMIDHSADEISTEEADILIKALNEQLADTESEIEHLESISNALDIARAESDLSQIKEELTEYGYIKKHYSGKKGAKAQTKSKPFHYISSDGFDIFVGKNNFQNDELTFKQATGNDWWFHAKKMAGSHVIVKTPDGELPDRTFEEAGRLAAYYSKGRTAPKVEIDYIQKKHVKKPGGAKPGFVVYYTNYSLMAEPDITGIQEVPSGK